MNVVSLFLDLSFIRGSGYKVLLLASKAGGHNAQKKNRLNIPPYLHLRRIYGQFTTNYTAKNRLALIVSLRQTMSSSQRLVDAI
jgi:hypothetical protein